MHHYIVILIDAFDDIIIFWNLFIFLWKPNDFFCMKSFNCDGAIFIFIWVNIALIIKICFILEFFMMRFIVQLNVDRAYKRFLL